MISIDIHNVEEIKQKTDKILGNNGKVFYTRTIEIINEKGEEIEISLYADEKKNLRINK